MKTRLFFFLLGVVTVLSLLEFVFRVLPVATATQSGYYDHPLILTYPPRHCFIASSGWDLKNPQHICTNKVGFVAERDFVQDTHAVALIGDSYVEANMLPADKRLAPALERRMNGRPVYALGGPGSNLLDYAVRAKFAADSYGTRTFVFVLERNDVKQARCGSGHVHGVCMDASTGRIGSVTQAPPGFLKRMLRQSAVAQYFASQLKIDLTTLISRGVKESTSSLKTEVLTLSDAQQKTVVDYFFQQIALIEGGLFIFVVDPDRGHLLEEIVDDNHALAEMIRRGGNGNAVVIDPRQEFRSYVLSTHKILAVGPRDLHWNGDTVEIVAKLVGDKLAKPESN